VGTVIHCPHGAAHASRCSCYLLPQQHAHARAWVQAAADRQRVVGAPARAAVDLPAPGRLNKHEGRLVGLPGEGKGSAWVHQADLPTLARRGAHVTRPPSATAAGLEGEIRGAQREPSMAF